MKETFKSSRVYQIAIFLLVGGIGIFIWWRLRWYTPVKKTSQENDAVQEAVPPSNHAKAKIEAKSLQPVTEGTGPHYYRHYSAAIANPVLTAFELLQLIHTDINQFIPQEIASFKKSRGHAESIQEGDEFDIQIVGPWNGPVHVIDVSDTSITLATKEGHLEAGEITFQIRPLPSYQAQQVEGYMFEIISSARSSNMLVDIFYDKLGVAKKVQASMWTFFCQRIVEESGGELVDKIKVSTERTPVEDDS